MGPPLVYSFLSPIPTYLSLSGVYTGPGYAFLGHCPGPYIALSLGPSWCGSRTPPPQLSNCLTTSLLVSSFSPLTGLGFSQLSSPCRAVFLCPVVSFSQPPPLPGYPKGNHQTLRAVETLYTILPGTLPNRK